LQVIASGIAGRPQIEAIPAQRGQPDKRRVRRTIRIG
jgi:hypothetical protein